MAKHENGGCIIPWCTAELRKILPDLSLHRFRKSSKENDIPSVWINRVRAALQDEGWNPTSSSRICSRHFPEDMRSKKPSGKVYLTECAVPSLEMTPPKAASEKRQLGNTTTQDISYTKIDMFPVFQIAQQVSLLNVQGLNKSEVVDCLTWVAAQFAQRLRSIGY